MRITIGDRYFVPRGQLASTLFNRGGTATGEYRKVAGGVVFIRPNGDPFACLVMNQHGERFFVTAHRCPCSGRPRFMFGLGESAADMLGLPESDSDRGAVAESIAAMF